MVIGDWITVAAVVIALALGVLALRQTNGIQVKQYKHLLINEIIDWATEITNAIRIEDIPIFGTSDLETVRKRVFMNKYTQLWALDARTHYMKHIAAFFPEVSNKLTEVELNLNELPKITGEVVEGKEEEFEDILSTYFRRLDTSAKELIRLAIQVKTQELI